MFSKLSDASWLICLVFYHFVAIKLELCGSAIVRWNKEDIKIDSEKVSGDCDKEKYFHKKIILADKGIYYCTVCWRVLHHFNFEPCFIS